MERIVMTNGNGLRVFYLYEDGSAEQIANGINPSVYYPNFKEEYTYMVEKQGYKRV